METYSRAFEPIEPRRWPTERPLFVLVVAVAAAGWLFLGISLVGALFLLAVASLLVMAQATFVAHVRGSAIHVGPEQLPEIHARVVELSQRMSMEPPETYVMQAGGALNALATRFLRTNIVVLFSDLLDACEGDDGARDMILAHELGHVRCGHLRWGWFLVPAYLVPFLGSALSRAREYTCDRFGLAGAGSHESAVRGLVILAAGPRFAPIVDGTRFVGQGELLNTGLMTLGEWMSSHPPLSRRVAAIGPVAPKASRVRGRVGALAILGAFGAAALVAAMVGLAATSGFLEGLTGPLEMPEASDETAMRSLTALRTFVEEEWAEGLPPESMMEIRSRWQEVRADSFPSDPYWLGDLQYNRVGNSIRLFSLGADLTPHTSDDVFVELPR